MSQPSELNIYFVLPVEDANADCSRDMYEAFRCVKNYKGKPKWMLPSECVAHHTNSNDVFVFDEFKGPAFEKLKKDSANVLGAKCMLQCLSSGDTIPPGDSPVFTEGMRGLIVCCAGFDPATKKSIQEKVEYMGGIFHPALRSVVTHVVAQNNLRMKAIEAYNAKKPVMTLEWIDAVWKRSQAANVRGSDAEFSKYISPLFHNLKITTSGISKRKKEEIKKLVTENGGLFTGQLEMNLTNVLIIETPDGDKYDAATNWNIPCVKSSWLRKCVELKKIVPLEQHLVEPKNKSSTPKKGTAVNLTQNFSMVSAIEPEDRHLTHLEESANMTLSQPFTAPKPDQLAEKIEQIYADAFRAGQFLDGCNVYLSGFGQSLAEKLKKVLNVGGATRFDDLTRAVTHIIVPKICSENLKETAAYVLPIDWLEASVTLKKPAPVEGYLLNSKTTATLAPPSPLSKQSARLLSRPEPKNLGPALEEIPLEEEPQDDLAYRYQQSQHGEPIANKTKRKASSHQSSASNSMTTSQSADGHVFSGLKFYLSTKLDEEELKGCEEEIINHGGQIVSKRFSGVPHYAVVPVTGESLTDITPLDIVNLFFIQECIEQNTVVAVQYYHQPFTYLAGSTPLKGCVICISKYVKCARDFVETVAEKLGAIVQATLARKQKEKILKTTHLICSEPSGDKYDGAVRWGLPVVDHNWLLKCAEVGVKVSEESFLLAGCKFSTPVSGRSNASWTNEITTTGRRKPEKAAEKIVGVSLFTEMNAEVGVDSRGPESPVVQKQSLIVDKVPTPRISTPELCKTPLNVSRSGTPLLQSQGFHRTVERLKNSETSRLSQSSDASGPATPTSPYGACFGLDSPSPRTRKRLGQWIESGASLPLDPPSKRVANSQRRDSTPLSDIISRQLRSMTRRPEDLPPEDSPSLTPTRKLSLIDDAILMRMKEIDDSYAKTNSAAPSPNQPPEEPQMLIVAESQPHTEVGWDDPCDRDFALAALEKEQQPPPDKIFMFSALCESADVSKQLIIESKGKVSPLQNFDKTATHLIASAKMTRAEKLLGSIAAGLWVLHPSYLKQLAVVKDVHALNEEDFEWGNPKISMPLDSLSANVRDCVVNAYHWRCEIEKSKANRPFADMRFILLIPSARRDVFSRLLDAGGGEIITADQVNPGKKNFCVSEMSAPPLKEDLETFGKRGVCCVTTLFISDVILRNPNAIKDNMVQNFAEIWERYNSSC